MFAAIKQTWWIVWWQLFAFLTPPPCSTFFLLKFQCQSLCGKMFFLLFFLLFFHSNCCKGCEKSSLIVSFCLFAACTWWEWEIFVEFSCGIFQRGFWGKSILHFTSHVRRLSCVCVYVFAHFFMSEMKWQSYNDFFASTFNKSRNAMRSAFFGRYDKLWATIIMWWEGPLNERRERKTNQNRGERRH